VLLRSRFDYEEANRFGKMLMKMSDAEVKLMMAQPQSLCQQIQKSGVKCPANWEKAIIEDMIWVKGGGPGARKSFVYYAPAQQQAPQERNASSNGSEDPMARTKAHNRNRASFVAQQPINGAALNEGDANRYKVASRAHASESISKDLADLVAELGQLEAGGKR